MLPTERFIVVTRNDGSVWVKDTETVTHLRRNSYKVANDTARALNEVAQYINGALPPHNFERLPLEPKKETAPELPAVLTKMYIVNLPFHECEVADVSHNRSDMTNITLTNPLTKESFGFWMNRQNADALGIALLQRHPSKPFKHQG
jgi:hypothetical protein